ncbi:2Fe-2S iron-sulfur cluster-binding protein [Variovorax terrae]|uniref:2Fe-2S iron-sulfur cluster binding domain-containing protein n=1 Tax=Variovorax terrae TaxID=2923278 RepID=A0A9X1VY62_9BURK|nr:2Fe-2S iron-sulfur cluster binding domain-containing protein [Variovorax terrae]MCJ0762728.1 2Fe-2S iron-sulfur cluster binding domain-containing protein [Variovorax terrae]
MTQATADKAFQVVLARSGRTVAVGEGESILDVLLLEGLDVPSSCQQGICGTCETRVLAGTPDHRDLLLSDSEKASGKTLLICCSRSHTDTLTLDL